MNKFKKRIAVFIVLGCMLLGISSSVWAADLSTDSTGIPSVSSGQKGPGQPDSERETTILSQLVQDGTLTQAEMDKIVTYLDEKRSAMQTNADKKNDTTGSDQQQMQPDQGNRPDMWSDLVTAGIITQTQADAISAKMGPKDAKPTTNSTSSTSNE